MVKDRTKNDATTTRLSLRHTYMPKFPVDFAGPSYFGGKDDQLVLCAGKGALASLSLHQDVLVDIIPAGDIHIWDRESGALLHHVRAQALGGDLTCIAWNPASDPFMFATGSHDGGVRIWTSPPSSANDMLIAPPSSRGTPGTTTPRTDTSLPTFQLDVDYRTDSPITQQEFDLPEGGRHSEPAEDSASPSRRTIAFTAPQALGNMYPS